MFPCSVQQQQTIQTCTMYICLALDWSWHNVQHGWRAIFAMVKCFLSEKKTCMTPSITVSITALVRRSLKPGIAVPRSIQLLASLSSLLINVTPPFLLRTPHRSFGIGPAPLWLDQTSESPIYDNVPSAHTRLATHPHTHIDTHTPTHTHTHTWGIGRAAGSLWG